LSHWEHVGKLAAVTDELGSRRFDISLLHAITTTRLTLTVPIATYLLTATDRPKMGFTHSADNETESKHFKQQHTAVRYQSRAARLNKKTKPMVMFSVQYRQRRC